MWVSRRLLQHKDIHFWHTLPTCGVLFEVKETMDILIQKIIHCCIFFFIYISNIVPYILNDIKNQDSSRTNLVLNWLNYFSQNYWKIFIKVTKISVHSVLIEEKSRKKCYVTIFLNLQNICILRDQSMLYKIKYNL